MFRNLAIIFPLLLFALVLIAVSLTTDFLDDSEKIADISSNTSVRSVVLSSIMSSSASIFVKSKPSVITFNNQSELVLRS